MEKIYDDLFKRLKTAADQIDLNDTSQVKYSLDQDIIFRGDLEKWRKFGNSLRLRLFGTRFVFPKLLRI